MNKDTHQVAKKLREIQTWWHARNHSELEKPDFIEFISRTCPDVFNTPTSFTVAAKLGIFKKRCLGRGKGVLWSIAESQISDSLINMYYSQYKDYRKGITKKKPHIKSTDMMQDELEKQGFVCIKKKELITFCIRHLQSVNYKVYEPVQTITYKEL